MAIDYDVPSDKKLLYWLGDKLIEYRHPVSIIVLIVTGLFAYWAFQLRLVTSFQDLVPQTHPYIEIHNRFSGTFGGANNITIMVEVKDGTIFNKDTIFDFKRHRRTEHYGLITSQTGVVVQQD
jgi:predicted RND superfamily exporter protein